MKATRTDREWFAHRCGELLVKEFPSNISNAIDDALERHELPNTPENRKTINDAYRTANPKNAKYAHNTYNPHYKKGEKKNQPARAQKSTLLGHLALDRERSIKTARDAVLNAFKAGKKCAIDPKHLDIFDKGIAINQLPPPPHSPDPQPQPTEAKEDCFADDPPQNSEMVPLPTTDTTPKKTKTSKTDKAWFAERCGELLIKDLPHNISYAIEDALERHELTNTPENRKTITDTYRTANPKNAKYAHNTYNPHYKKGEKKNRQSRAQNSTILGYLAIDRELSIKAVRDEVLNALKAEKNCAINPEHFPIFDKGISINQLQQTYSPDPHILTDQDIFADEETLEDVEIEALNQMHPTSQPT